MAYTNPETFTPNCGRYGDPYANGGWRHRCRPLRPYLLAPQATGLPFTPEPTATTEVV
ncbi:MAG: hypothetical protein H6668_08415 [Ardenticatenaceae bacterium]|nr:hypothetical protein [Ardenticatenaceae bacterium]